MARYKHLQRVRIKHTLIPLTVIDVFDNDKDSKYQVAYDNGETKEFNEAELRASIKDSMKSAILNNPNEFSFLVGMLVGLLLGIILF